MQCSLKSCPNSSLDIKSSTAPIHWLCSFCQWDYRRHHLFGCSERDNKAVPNYCICHSCYQNYPRLTFPQVRAVTGPMYPNSLLAYQKEVSVWVHYYLSIGFSRENLIDSAQSSDWNGSVIQTGCVTQTFQQLNNEQALLQKHIRVVFRLPESLLRLIAQLTIP